jgi:hypothetical protein
VLDRLQKRMDAFHRPAQPDFGHGDHGINLQQEGT